MLGARRGDRQAVGGQRLPGIQGRAVDNQDLLGGGNLRQRCQRVLHRFHPASTSTVPVRTTVAQTCLPCHARAGAGCLDELPMEPGSFCGGKCLPADCTSVAAPTFNRIGMWAWKAHQQVAIFQGTPPVSTTRQDSQQARAVPASSSQPGPRKQCSEAQPGGQAAPR